MVARQSVGHVHPMLALLFEKATRQLVRTNFVFSPFIQAL
jgi:hypothetical protein